MSVSEQRTWYSHTQSDPVSVSGGVEIESIPTIIENTSASLVSIKTTLSAAGKLYYVDENGNSHYLTDPNNDWPAEMVILATTFVKTGTSISLRFSTDATMYDLYVSHTGGLF